MNIYYKQLLNVILPLFYTVTCSLVVHIEETNCIKQQISLTSQNTDVNVEISQDDEES